MYVKVGYRRNRLGIGNRMSIRILVYQTFHRVKIGILFSLIISGIFRLRTVGRSRILDSLIIVGNLIKQVPAIDHSHLKR